MYKELILVIACTSLSQGSILSAVTCHDLLAQLVNERASKAKVAAGLGPAWDSAVFLLHFSIWFFNDKFSFAILCFLWLVLNFLIYIIH